MSEQETIYDPAFADARFQVEILSIRWALVALYALLTAAGVVDADPRWFAISEGFLVAYHVYYTWYVWHELNRDPLPPATAYATPFMDTVAVSLGLIAVGDPLHPIWGVYFFILVGVTFFYYPIARAYVFWLLANYAFVGWGLQLRGLYVPVPQMGVGAIILLMALYNLVAYTGGERRLRRHIAKAARTDPLTNLLNRRGLEEALSERLAVADQENGAVAVFMVDVDRFKRYNDQFGHLAADGVLEALADQLAAAAHDRELVARYGGDEFVMIVPDVTAEDALLLAERLRQQVARVGLCTVSIGVSMANGGHGGGAKELLDLADAALLVAKQSGRNCVRAATLEPARAA